MSRPQKFNNVNTKIIGKRVPVTSSKLFDDIFEVVTEIYISNYQRRNSHEDAAKGLISVHRALTSMIEVNKNENIAQPDPVKPKDTSKVSAPTLTQERRFYPNPRLSDSRKVLFEK